MVQIKLNINFFPKICSCWKRRLKSSSLTSNLTCFPVHFFIHETYCCIMSLNDDFSKIGWIGKIRGVVSKCRVTILLHTVLLIALNHREVVLEKVGITYRGFPQSGPPLFSTYPRHNSTTKIVDRDIFRHYSTVEKCRIALNNVAYCRILSNIVEYCRILSNIVE